MDSATGGLSSSLGIRHYEEEYAKAQILFKSVKQMYFESRLPIIKTLAHQTVVGIHTVESLASSRKIKAYEDNLLRMLQDIKKQHISLLTTEQSKELDAMVHSLESYNYEERSTDGPNGLVSAVSTNASLPELEESDVTSRMESTPLLDHPMVCDIGETDRITPRSVEGAFEAFLRYEPSAVKFSDSASAANIPNSSGILGSSSSDSSITSSCQNQTSKDSEIVRELGDEAQTTSLLSHQQSDSSSLVTTNLENIAVSMSNLPSTSTSLAVPQNTYQIVRKIEGQNKMIAERKLCLVLDLDHTLLDSAKIYLMDPKHDEKLKMMEVNDRVKSQRHLFRFEQFGIWTKLRPGVWNFLDKASKLFELHIYTMGNEMYATEMARLLDPTGTLFAGRVISRGDDSNLVDGVVPKVKDLDCILATESVVVIIDDSPIVWPNNKKNLMVVERYTYFPASRRQFGLTGPSLFEIDRDESVKDGTLASLLVVIERIHNNFFSNGNLYYLDVRNVLASEQSKILAGCRIVFSRIFPVEEANPHLHPLWQTAEQFGATCTNEVDEQVTHVVANTRGTDKVNWALSMGRFVVRPDWLEASALLYRRANEQYFAVKKLA